MDIKILGFDCPYCDKLHRRTIKALRQLNIEANVERVDDPMDMWSYGIADLPVLVIDGHIASQGKILTLIELKKIIIHTN